MGNRKKVIVWVLETGVYSQRMVEGVYPSLEEAMEGTSGNWKVEDWDDRELKTWSNDLDHDWAASAIPFEMEIDCD